MPAYAMLRIEKLKTWGDIAGLDAHNARKRATPNADPERLQDNRVLIGNPKKDIPTAVKEAIDDQNIRKNAVLAPRSIVKKFEKDCYLLEIQKITVFSVQTHTEKYGGIPKSWR